eukprot:15460972-Alexandrium_andersonii.AAC.1
MCWGSKASDLDFAMDSESPRTVPQNGPVEGSGEPEPSDFEMRCFTVQVGCPTEHYLHHQR